MKLIKGVHGGWLRERDVDWIKIYDADMKDYFGHKFYILHNEIENAIRLISKNNEHSRRRKLLDSIGCEHVVVSREGEVIDITRKTLERLKRLFPNAKMTYLLQVWEAA